MDLGSAYLKQKATTERGWVTDPPHQEGDEAEGGDRGDEDLARIAELPGARQ